MWKMYQLLMLMKRIYIANITSFFIFGNSNVKEFPFLFKFRAKDVQGAVNDLVNTVSQDAENHVENAEITNNAEAEET